MIATLDMQRTYCVAKYHGTREDFTYYAPVLCLNGRPTTWSSGRLHRTPEMAARRVHLGKFKERLEAIFTQQDTRIVDPNVNHGFTGEPMWEYHYRVDPVDWSVGRYDGRPVQIRVGWAHDIVEIYPPEQVVVST